jgi:hypothetical protein
MAVDSVATEAKTRDFLRGRFEACYPFHTLGSYGISGASKNQ